MTVSKTTTLLQKTGSVERLAAGSRWDRLFRHPIRYSLAILLKNFLYPVFQKERACQCDLFTGQKMNILLPAATDIYLTGGKSHISEIKLARFIIQNLHHSGVFWDVGAHYGYFSLLAAGIVGEEGVVLSMEAAPHTFDILKSNTLHNKQMTGLQCAVTDEAGEKFFFEMPNLYSEYNTTDIKQFEKESWFEKNRPEKVKVAGITLDILAEQFGQVPDIIKIDVEGGERAVIRGGAKLLSGKQPVVVMEYLSPQRHNRAHQEAAALLAGWGYSSFVIEEDGGLRRVQDLDGHLTTLGLESDNIVFKRDERLCQ